jgi:hypothetical protein
MSCYVALIKILSILRYFSSSEKQRRSAGNYKTFQHKLFKTALTNRNFVDPCNSYS